MGNDDKKTEDPAGEPEKTFTQAEVNEIIKNRLARYKEDAAATAEEISKRVEEATAAKAAELSALENKLNCRQYLIDNGLPEEFLETLDTSDPEVFKAKTEKMINAVKKKNPGYSAPIGSGEPTITGRIPNEFSREYRHKPREFGKEI